MRKSKVKEEKTIALFVDGPNMLRKEFMIDLRELRRIAGRYGRVMIAKVFLNQFAPEKLIEAVINEGFEPVMVLGENEESDVDVAMATEIMETVLTKNVDFIGIVTRDADFIPVIQKVKSYGKKTVLFCVEPGSSAGLKNSADYVELL